MTVLKSSSSRPAGRETWGGHGVVARGPPNIVYQADESRTRPVVTNFIASTIISVSEQISIFHLIECIGIISRETKGYVPQANFWHAYLLLNFSVERNPAWGANSS
jgi:hypothetical protein